jgi:galactofuranosylgalactofuranosylrhamnosyl-N-acetylglucosaminyl-diphospho-decaprenol beta-1,5/1,6-galactofuranosyltransferase
MNVINRIQFPITVETSNLYMKCNEGASVCFYQEHTEITFTKNGVLSLNTYFNSFYEKFYAKYTVINSLYYCLNLAGNFEVYLYRESHSKENRDLIHVEIFENCQLSEAVKISLPSSWYILKLGV